MKIKYRLMTSHSGDPSKTHSQPSFEGDCVEACDKKAIAHLEEISKDPNLAWGELNLYRIDTEEVTTYIGTSLPENHLRAKRIIALSKQLPSPVKEGSLVIITTEWGPDLGPNNSSQATTRLSSEENQKEGWALPTLQDFFDAQDAGLRGFLKPHNHYWAQWDDCVIIVKPRRPTNFRACGKNDVAPRLRLIRRLSVKTN